MKRGLIIEMIMVMVIVAIEKDAMDSNQEKEGRESVGLVLYERKNYLRP